MSINAYSYTYGAQIQIQQPTAAPASTGQATPVQLMVLGPTAIVDFSTTNTTNSALTGIYTNQTGSALVLPVADPHVYGAVYVTNTGAGNTLVLKQSAQAT